MQSFFVLASLVFELAGGGGGGGEGQNDSLLSPLRYKKHLSPLKVKQILQMNGSKTWLE